MDIKQLLEKMDQFAGQTVGQKPGDQWRGTDSAPPGKKLVGDSILKDLQKGKTPKNREQELSEEFEAFLQALEEENIGTHPKRPGRKSDRHSRGHEPQARYKTIKADEAANPAQQAAIAIAMKKAGKKPKQVDEGSDTEYTVHMDRNGRERSTSGTIAELLDYFGYTLEVGKSYEHEKGRYKINMNPTSIGQLVDALNKAQSNSAANGQASTHYSMNEGVAYKATNQHPASRDPIVAKVVKQMRPGLTGLDMGNEAFLYFAYELGKQRARDAWSDYLPSIRAEYEKRLAEGWESGPEEYEEPYDDADDAYDRQRTAKADDEARAEWEKKPKKTTYKLYGRGPNMEPNYEFGGELDSLDQALEYRKELMADPKTPHPEHISIHTIQRLADEDQIDEGVDTFNRGGYNPLRDQRDYLDKFKDLWDLYHTPNLDQQTKAETKQRILDLNAEARTKGYIQAESRGHTVIANKLKDIERAKKFASGELKVPTPQERQAQLKQLEKAKPVKEYGANNPPQGLAVTPYGQPATDPKQAQAVAQATQALKSATHSTAPTTTITKALDAASQGKPVGQQDMKNIEPIMKDIATVAQDPKLANQFKTLAQQIQQTQLKQQQK